MRRARTRLTFTNRLLLLAVFIVATTTLVLVATTSAGVYRLASDAQFTREAAFRDILAAQLDGRLQGAYDLLRVTGEEPSLVSTDQAEFQRVLSSFTVETAQYFEGMVLLDADGRVAAAWPATVVDGITLETIAAAEASPAVAPFYWDPPAGDRGGTLWALVTLKSDGEAPRHLMGRLRTEFIERSLTDISHLHGLHTAMVFDGQDRLIYLSRSDLDLSGASYEFTADPGDPKTGELRVFSGEAQAGPYAEVVATGGLGWKVAVVEPLSVAWRETWSAVRSGLPGWVAALVVALLASLVVVNRVTRPLKELEQRARALAAGLPIQPEAVPEKHEIGRLLEAFNSVARRLNRLNDIADLLASASDRSLVLASITASIVHMLSSVDAEVLLLSDGGRLNLVSTEGALGGHEGISFSAAEVPWIASAIASGQPVRATRQGDDAFFEPHGANASYALAAPLRAGAGVIGAAVVVRHGDLPFTDAECETVRAFAAQASVALQTSRLFEEERRSRREAEALREVAERVAASGEVEQTLLDIAQMDADLLGFGASIVVLRDRAAYGLPVEAETPSDRAWFAAWKALAPDGGTDSDPVYVDTTTADRAVRKALHQCGASGALLSPLYRGAGLAGLIVLLAEEPRGVPSSRRLALAGTAGRQASLALENAYLFQQAKNRADNLETIFRISHAVGSSLQTRVVLNRVLDVVQKILAADAVMLMTYDAQRKYITVPMARGILNREMLEATFRPGEDVPGRVFETLEPERYDHISSADTRLLNSAAAQGLESLLAVPLLARGRSIGVLAVFARSEAAFTSEELDLLRTFASQAALSIDTAAMFSREHNVATILQESIRPTSLPRIPGIEASGVYLPAGTDADIGGDYYDLFTAPDGRVVVSIGDVCGKGARAATKTSMIRFAIRGMVVAGLEPNRILAELNGMLLEIGDQSSIVTLWLGFINIDSGELLYADGGHPPALLLDPSDRRIERLSTTGALLGAVADTSWAQRVVHLEPGSMLLLYTDGVTEARSGVRFFGEGRVRRALRAGGSVAGVAQRLFAKVQRFAAGELRDDAAILAIAYLPEGGVVSDVEQADTGRNEPGTANVKRGGSK